MAKNRRFVVVVVEPMARSVKRFSIERSSVVMAATGCIAFVTILILMAIHGAARFNAARESIQISQKNAQLTRIAQELDDRLPALEAANLQATLAFSKLWSKSGLGIAPETLGIGPLKTGTQDESGALATAINGQVLSTSDIALPLEADRIADDARLLQHTLAETFEYFHDAQRLLQNTPSLRPTRSPWLTSNFGKRRDPLNAARWVMHKGVDLGGYIGQEILCPADGVIIWVGYRGGYGKTVVIDHGYGLQTHYGHLDGYRVERGERVARGQVIAEMGSTGRSTGPHLHYEVRRLGHPLDPIPFVLN